ncbi:MAG: hypothetical protein MUD01_21300 [Chloroflexaceae bacterium]|nr:hypothetical protein [Chloroflexaceae bacterium]
MCTIVWPQLDNIGVADVTGLALASDGALLSVATEERCWLWQLANGELRQTLASGAQQVVIGPNGTTVAFITGATITVYRQQGATLHARQTLVGHAEEVAAAAFTPDAHALVSVAHDGIVRRWLID